MLPMSYCLADVSRLSFFHNKPCPCKATFMFSSVKEGPLMNTVLTMHSQASPARGTPACQPPQGKPRPTTRFGACSPRPTIRFGASSPRPTTRFGAYSPRSRRRAPSRVTCSVAIRKPRALGRPCQPDRLDLPWCGPLYRPKYMRRAICRH
jgi:hypothetical protein